LPAFLRVAGQEATGLLGEVVQDRTALEDAEAVVADRRDAPVRRDLDEPRLALLTASKVDRAQLVRELALLEHDAHLPAVGGRSAEEFEHPQVA